MEFLELVAIVLGELVVGARRVAFFAVDEAGVNEILQRGVEMCVTDVVLVGVVLDVVSAGPSRCWNQGTSTVLPTMLSSMTAR